MSHQKKITSLIILLFLLTLAYSLNASGRGIGVGPTYIRLDSALRNATYQQTVFIYNQNEYNSTMLLNSTGDIGDWVSFYEFNNLEQSINSTLVQNMSSKGIVIKISIPTDTSNREYNGTVVVTSEPVETNVSGNYTTVSLNIPILLSINVTGEQDLNVSVWFIEIDNVEINYPSRLRVQFKNTGNVVAAPLTEVTITKDGMYIDRVSSTAYPIQPDKISTQTIVWNTTGKISGDYVAHFNITLGGEVIHTKDVSFELFPIGTFTRNGTLLDLKYEGKPEKGKLLKIIASFRNTGDVETIAKFIGEVYRDGELVDTIESNEITVPKYGEENLVAYYTIEEKGTHVISGYVLYGGKKTNTIELSFGEGVTEALPFGFSTIILSLVLIVAIGLVVLFIIQKKGLVDIKKLVSLRSTDSSANKKVKRGSIKNIIKAREDILADIRKHLSIHGAHLFNAKKTQKTSKSKKIHGKRKKASSIKKTREKIPKAKKQSKGKPTLDLSKYKITRIRNLRIRRNPKKSIFKKLRSEKND